MTKDRPYLTGILIAIGKVERKGWFSRGTQTRLMIQLLNDHFIVRYNGSIHPDSIGNWVSGYVGPRTLHERFLERLHRFMPPLDEAPFVHTRMSRIYDQDLGKWYE